jgi:hypothetical protein
MIRPFGSVAAVVAVAAAVGVLTGAARPATDDLALKSGKVAEASEIEGGHTIPF